MILSQDFLIGGLIGFIPAITFIYMGTRETGQIIKETPFGVILLIYYLVCMVFIYIKRKKS